MTGVQNEVYRIVIGTTIICTHVGIIFNILSENLKKIFKKLYLIALRAFIEIILEDLSIYTLDKWRNDTQHNDI